jgi:hypothetical protein
MFSFRNICSFFLEAPKVLPKATTAEAEATAASSYH